MINNIAYSKSYFPPPGSHGSSIAQDGTIHIDVEMTTPEADDGHNME
jgi:hypothetical protein